MKKTIFKLLGILIVLIGITTIGYAQNNISALRFNGTNSDVNISEDYLVGESNFTIEAWVRLEGSKTKGVIVQRAGCYYMYSNTNDRLSFALRYVSNGTLYWAYYHSNNNALPHDNSWHHVAVIRNTAPNPNTLKLYVDGSEVTNGTWSGYPTRNKNNKEFYIGDNGGSGSTWNFEGKIDEVRLKNVAEDISDLHYQKTDEEYTKDGNTEALFHFNENTGTTTANAAGGSATINGATWATYNDLWFPIELKSFYATRIDNGIELNWATLSETNNKGFEIQRSDDATNWEVLGFVEGQGNSRDEINYSFIDKNPEKVNYYRLNQVDLGWQQQVFRCTYRIFQYSQ